MSYQNDDHHSLAGSPPSASDVSQLDALMTQIDKCSAVVRESVLINDETKRLLYDQAIVFAAFLTDLSEGKIEAEASLVDSMLDDCAAYCLMIRTRLQPVAEDATYE